MKGEETIFVMDRIVSLPGRGAEVHRYYVEHYVPVALARGLTLKHRWVSPPVWLEDGQSNTLCFIWSVTGVSGYWGVEARARWDETSSLFWQGLAPMIESRTRSVMAEDIDIGTLCDV